MRKNYLSLVAMLAVAGCASANTIQTSADTAIVQASAEAACGSIGAARVAQKQAAKATLLAGFDRYVIMNAASGNNVQTSQLPGTYNTSAQVYGNSVYAQTTYTPGMMVTTGNFDQAFAVKMFRDGDPGAAQAISARTTLGPEWQKEMKRNTLDCL